MLKSITIVILILLLNIHLSYGCTDTEYLNFSTGNCIPYSFCPSGLKKYTDEKICGIADCFADLGLYTKYNNVQTAMTECISETTCNTPNTFKDSTQKICLIVNCANVGSFKLFNTQTCIPESSCDLNLKKEETLKICGIVDCRADLENNYYLKYNTNYCIEDSLCSANLGKLTDSDSGI